MLVVDPLDNVRPWLCVVLPDACLNRSLWLMDLRLMTLNDALPFRCLFFELLFFSPIAILYDRCRRYIILAYTGAVVSLHVEVP